MKGTRKYTEGTVLSVYFFMKKLAKILAYIRYFLYLCIVLELRITSGKRPPGVVGRTAFLIP